MRGLLATCLPANPQPWYWYQVARFEQSGLSGGKKSVFDVNNLQARDFRPQYLKVIPAGHNIQLQTFQQSCLTSNNPTTSVRIPSPPLDCTPALKPLGQALHPQMEGTTNHNTANATEQFGYAGFAGFDTPPNAEAPAGRADDPQFDMYALRNITLPCFKLIDNLKLPVVPTIPILPTLLRRTRSTVRSCPSGGRLCQHPPSLPTCLCCRSSQTTLYTKHV